MSPFLDLYVVCMEVLLDCFCLAVPFLHPRISRCIDTAEASIVGGEIPRL